MILRAKQVAGTRRTHAARGRARPRTRSRIAATSFSAARWRAFSSESFAPSVSRRRSRSSSSLKRRSISSSRVLVDLVELLDQLGLEVRQVGVTALLVDPGHEVGGEVDDLLELLGLQLLTDLGAHEEVREPRTGAAEVPDVHDGRGELDVAHALAAHLRARDLDATALADDALEPDALVLAAVALPVLRGTEDLLAEEPVLLGLERAVVDGLRLLDLAVRPRADRVGRGQPDAQLIEVVDVEHQ